MQKKEVKMIRINSRIWPDQFKFVKGYAKKLKVSEGEAFRSILETFMKR